MLLTPLNSWCLISIGDTGSSEWYANTTFAEPTCNESNLLIENHDHQHFYTSLYQEFGLFSTTEFRGEIKVESCNEYAISPRCPRVLTVYLGKTGNFGWKIKFLTFRLGSFRKHGMWSNDAVMQVFSLQSFQLGRISFIPYCSPTSSFFFFGKIYSHQEHQHTKPNEPKCIRYKNNDDDDDNHNK